jgi:hypothetical protein
MIQERRRAASEEGFCIRPACGERAEYQRGAPVGRRGVLDVLRMPREFSCQHELPGKKRANKDGQG